MKIIPQWLSDLFSRESNVPAAEPEPVAVINNAPDMTDVIENIRTWLNKLIAGIENESKKYAQTDKSEKYKNIYSLSVGRRFRDMSQDDWNSLLPELHDLYEVCRENDVKIELTGFDSLPRAGFLTEFETNICPYKLGVSVTFGESYALRCNPFSEGQVKKVLQHKVSQPIPSRLRPESSEFKITF